MLTCELAHLWNVDNSFADIGNASLLRWMASSFAFWYIRAVPVADQECADASYWSQDSECTDVEVLVLCPPRKINYTGIWKDGGIANMI